MFRDLDDPNVALQLTRFASTLPKCRVNDCLEPRDSKWAFHYCFRRPGTKCRAGTPQ